MSIGLPPPSTPPSFSAVVEAGSDLLNEVADAAEDATDHLAQVASEGLQLGPEIAVDTFGVVTSIASAIRAPIQDWANSIADTVREVNVSKNAEANECERIWSIVGAIVLVSVSIVVTTIAVILSLRSTLNTGAAAATAVVDVATGVGRTTVNAGVVAANVGVTVATGGTYVVVKVIAMIEALMANIAQSTKVNGQVLAALMIELARSASAMRQLRWKLEKHPEQANDAAAKNRAARAQNVLNKANRAIDSLTDAFRILAATSRPAASFEQAEREAAYALHRLNLDSKLYRLRQISERVIPTIQRCLPQSVQSARNIAALHELRSHVHGADKILTEARAAQQIASLRRITSNNQELKTPIGGISGSRR